MENNLPKVKFKRTGAYLKQCREKKNISQAEVAHKFKYTNQYVCNWERGVSAPPAMHWSNLVKLIGADIVRIHDCYLQDIQDRSYQRNKRGERNAITLHEGDDRQKQ